MRVKMSKQPPPAPTARDSISVYIGDHLYGKLLFTWLSLVMSMMVSVFFVLPFSPRDVLDEILNLIESVSEGFLSYSYIGPFPKEREKEERKDR